MEADPKDRGCSVQKNLRLRKNRDYQRVYRRGKSLAMPLAALVYMQSNGWGKKAGFSVSKKVGNAVTRNKVRRRMKEIVRPHMPRIKRDVHMIFVARPLAASATFDELDKTIAKLLKRSKLEVDEA